MSFQISRNDSSIICLGLRPFSIFEAYKLDIDKALEIGFKLEPPYTLSDTVRLDFTRPVNFVVDNRLYSFIGTIYSLNCTDTVVVENALACTSCVEFLMSRSFSRLSNVIENKSNDINK